MANNTDISTQLNSNTHTEDNSHSRLVALKIMRRVTLPHSSTQSLSCITRHLPIVHVNKTAWRTICDNMFFLSYAKFRRWPR